MTRQEAAYVAGFSVVGLGALLRLTWEFFLCSEQDGMWLGRTLRLRG